MNEELYAKINNDTTKGLLIEDLFIKLVENEGYRCYKASQIENMREHWDVCIIKEINGIKIFERVDVKSNKEAHAEGYTWVELQNVQGNTGWLYSEYMDVIAFERTECFELVRRIDLVKIVEENVKKAELEDGESIIYCNKNGLKDYRIYRRAGRNDRLIKIPFSDFKHLIYKKIGKI